MSQRAVLGFGAAGALLLTVPALQKALGLPVYTLVFLYFIYFWSTQASSWNLLSGYTGYFSFGQGAFFGSGVYATAILTSKFGVGLLPALAIAGLVAALIGVVMGLIVFRLRKLREEIFALLTLAVAMGMHSIVNISKFLDGGRGVPLKQPRYPAFLGSDTTMLYYLGLTLAFLSVFSVYWIHNSRLGKGLLAIREDEPVAENLGVPTFRYKMIALAISSFLAGISGGLHAFQLVFITADSVFTLKVPLFVIIMSFLGGRDHWMGPVVGATVIFTLTDRLSGAGMEDWSQIITGLTIIVVILYLRDGIYRRLAERAWASLAAFTGGLAMLLFLGAGRGVLDLVAFSMVAVLALLLIPTKLYRAVMRRQSRAVSQGPGKREVA